jgi:hypothetical protein
MIPASTSQPPPPDRPPSRRREAAPCHRPFTPRHPPCWRGVLCRFPHCHPPLLPTPCNEPAHGFSIPRGTPSFRSTDHRPAGRTGEARIQQGPLRTSPGSCRSRCSPLRPLPRARRRISRHPEPLEPAHLPARPPFRPPPPPVASVIAQKHQEKRTVPHPRSTSHQTFNQLVLGSSPSPRTGCRASGQKFWARWGGGALDRGFRCGWPGSAWRRGATTPRPPSTPPARTPPSPRAASPPPSASAPCSRSSPATGRSPPPTRAG